MSGSPSKTSQGRGFDELSRMLDQLGSMTGLSECHGLITGYLCVKREFDGPEELCAILEVPSVRFGNGHSVAILESLASETFRQLESEDCEFQPLLPDDTEPLTDRIAALGEWCHGFLLGVGFSGYQKIPDLAFESREFIQDLTALTRAGTSPGASEEDDERAFSEVVEYIRAGVLLFREEALHRVNPGEEN